MLTHIHLKEWRDERGDYRVAATYLDAEVAQRHLAELRAAEPGRRFFLGECTSACGYTITAGPRTVGTEARR